MQRFPPDFGALASKTFEEVFLEDPKWIEFVREQWLSDSCTGLFKDFFNFVMKRLESAAAVVEHEDRCREYCKDIDFVSLPRYMLKYK